MRLGNSLRRRRGGGSGSGGSRKKRTSTRRRRTSGGGGTGLRTFGMVLLVATLGTGFGWIFATQVLFPAPAPPEDLRAIPALAGLSLAQAAAAVEDAGLILGDTASIRHPRADSGAVLGQSPLAGQLALPGAAVDLTLSAGPERREVPDVGRLRGDRATQLLRASGFEVVVDSAESPQARGRILSVDPTPGSALELPGAVRLTVSVGPRTVEVPYLLGMDVTDAQDSLRALGLRVSEVEEVFRFGRDQGRVVEQEPVEGARLDRGASVRLVIGRRGGIPQDR